MLDSLDQVLVLIKEELDAEVMDKAQIDQLFQKLRDNIESVLLEESKSVEEKEAKLSMVSELLIQYEKEVRQQRRAIQDGLKKISKGRRSMKEYQKNT